MKARLALWIVAIGVALLVLALGGWPSMLYAGRSRAPACGGGSRSLRGEPCCHRPLRRLSERLLALGAARRRRRSHRRDAAIGPADRRASARLEHVALPGLAVRGRAPAAGRAPHRRRRPRGGPRRAGALRPALPAARARRETRGPAPPRRPRGGGPRRPGRRGGARRAPARVAARAPRAGGQARPRSGPTAQESRLSSASACWFQGTRWVVPAARSELRCARYQSYVAQSVSALDRRGSQPSSARALSIETYESR